MANFLKDEINHIGDRIEIAIEKASKELNSQRALTREDLKDIVRYAGEQFGTALDIRIEKAKYETSDLITSKLLEFRIQLSDAATEQKRTAIRNASIAITASFVVGIISLAYRKILHGELDLLDIFRSVLLALGTGYFCWIAFKFIYRFFKAPEITKNALIVGVGYLDILKPKGAAGHITILILVFSSWLLLNNLDKLPNLFK